MRHSLMFKRPITALAFTLHIGRSFFILFLFNLHLISYCNQTWFKSNRVRERERKQRNIKNLNKQQLHTHTLIN